MVPGTTNSIRQMHQRCVPDMQDALPAVLDLQMRAIEQPVSRSSRRPPKVPGIGDDTGAHFSREYMSQVVQEVQQALSTAGMDGPAKQAEGLLAASTAPPCQPLPVVSTAATSSSVDIIASELSALPCFQTWHACVSLLCSECIAFFLECAKFSWIVRMAVEWLLHVAVVHKSVALLQYIELPNGSMSYHSKTFLSLQCSLLYHFLSACTCHWLCR